MSTRRRDDGWRSWSGWIGGATGWFLSQQLGSDLALGQCATTGPLAVALIGFSGLALAALGAFLSAPAWRDTAPPLGNSNPHVRSFIAISGAGAAAIFACAIVLQTLSAFVIPACYA